MRAELLGHDPVGTALLQSQDGDQTVGIAIRLKVLKGKRNRKRVICLVQVLPPPFSFNEWDLIRVDLRRVVLGGKAFVCLLDFGRVKAAISIDVKELVRVELPCVLATLVDSLLDLDQVVSINHPLADEGEESPLDHPLAVAEVVALFSRAALGKQEGESQEDQAALHAKHHVQASAVVVSDKVYDALHFKFITNRDNSLTVTVRHISS